MWSDVSCVSYRILERATDTSSPISLIRYSITIIKSHISFPDNLNVFQIALLKHTAELLSVYQVSNTIDILCVGNLPVI